MSMFCNQFISKVSDVATLKLKEVIAMPVGGLDLAAYEHRCSGFAVIDDVQNRIKELKCLYEDEEIIENVEKFAIEVLAIDAPLIEQPRFREVDAEAIRRGYRVLPPTFKYMRLLTLRAWKLYQRLQLLGVVVIETHPKSALKSSGFSNVIELCKALNLVAEVHADKLKHRDLRDALTSALVALCYKKRTCITAISAADGAIYLISITRTLEG